MSWWKRPKGELNIRGEHVDCHVKGCQEEAVRSLPSTQVRDVMPRFGLKKRLHMAHLCRWHLREYRKGSRRHWVDRLIGFFFPGRTKEQREGLVDDEGNRLCDVKGCRNHSKRSLSTRNVTLAFPYSRFKTRKKRRVLLCKEHYKRYRKATKEKRELDRLARRSPRPPR